MAEGLSRYNISAIAVNPSIPTVIYAGTYGDSLYRSTDGGGHWMLTHLGLDDNVGTQAVNAVVPDPQVAETLYIGTNHGVYKSEDGGGSWKSANMGIGNRFAIALAMSPRNRNVLVAGTHAGIYKTINGGATWALAPVESKSWAVNALLFDSQETLYAATDRGIHAMTVGSATSRLIGPDDRFVTALALTASQPLYAGGHDGVYRMTDSAIPLSDSPRAVTALVIHPHKSETLFAGTTHGLYKSDDAGLQWRPLAIP
jgi:ligand-binding sensor domain-containing protein